jgi:hypothetical protein
VTDTPKDYESDASAEDEREHRLIRTNRVSLDEPGVTSRPVVRMSRADLDRLGLVSDTGSIVLTEDDLERLGAVVKTRSAPEPMSTLAVRMAGGDIDRIRAHADSLGLGVTQLARIWLLERLAAEESVTREEVDAGLRQLIDEAESLRRRLTQTQGLWSDKLRAFGVKTC